MELYISRFCTYFYALSTLELIVLIGLILSFLIQLFYYLRYFTGIFRKNSLDTKKKTNYSKHQAPVSIIVCARDEEFNLKRLLPKLLEQNYPEFEVIVVDDQSTDETKEVLDLFKQKYSNLRCTFVPIGAKMTSSKKLAISLGVRSAKHDLLLLTDADCLPSSKNWISSMTRNFTSKTDLILGYGAYLEKKGFLNRLIVFDTLFIAIQYLNYTLAGKAYMGVGRNIAYRKHLFVNSKGFSKHLNLQSGDDDLFVNAVANKENTRIEFDTDSHTHSEPEITFRMWKRQKERHLSTSSYYKRSSLFLLGVELSSRTCFYLLLIISLFTLNQTLMYISAGLFLTRYLTQYIIINKSAKLLHTRKYYWGILLFDTLLPLINLALKIKSSLAKDKRYRWK